MNTFFNTTFFILFFIQITTAQTFTDTKGKTHLWGKVTLEDFNSDHYSDWYEANYEEYSPKINFKDRKALKDISVKIFIGTWCGDTKHLFPQFTKYWHEMGLSEVQMEIIALHREDELYKQGPNDENKGYDIHKVPTFIFNKEGQEIGRIVERTVFDLETDIHLIANDLPYKNRYQGVSIASDIMAENMDSLHTDSTLKTAKRRVRREVSRSSELNIYAWTLYYAGDIEKATFIWKLNKELFPYEPYVNFAWGNILNEIGEYEEAKIALREALRLEPELDAAISCLYEINEKEAKEEQ